MTQMIAGGPMAGMMPGGGLMRGFRGGYRGRGRGRYMPYGERVKPNLSTTIEVNAFVIFQPFSKSPKMGVAGPPHSARR